MIKIIYSYLTNTMQINLLLAHWLISNNYWLNEEKNKQKKKNKEISICDLFNLNQADKTLL